MTFSDGWVCRSCWKPNRPQDARCYRCKTERDADASSIEANRAQRETEKARRDRVPIVVGEIPARIFAWYGRLGIVAAFLAAVAFVLALAGPPARQADAPVIAVIAVALLAYGITMRWAAGEMRAARFWGFAVALIVSVAALAFYLTILAYIPAGIGEQGITRYTGVAIFGLAAVLALVGIVMLGSPGDEATAKKR
jgi:hypothetical protein